MLSRRVCHKLQEEQTWQEGLEQDKQQLRCHVQQFRNGRSLPSKASTARLKNSASCVIALAAARFRVQADRVARERLRGACGPSWPHDRLRCVRPESVCGWSLLSSWSPAFKAKRTRTGEVAPSSRRLRLGASGLPRATGSHSEQVLILRPLSFWTCVPVFQWPL